MNDERKPALRNLLGLFDPNGSYDGWDVQERIRSAYADEITGPEGNKSLHPKVQRLLDEARAISHYDRQYSKDALTIEALHALAERLP